MNKYKKVLHNMQNGCMIYADKISYTIIRECDRIEKVYAIIDESGAQGSAQIGAT